MDDALSSNRSSLFAVRHGVLEKCGWGVAWVVIGGEATIYNSGGAVSLKP